MRSYIGRQVNLRPCTRLHRYSEALPCIARQGLGLYGGRAYLSLTHGGESNGALLHNKALGRAEKGDDLLDFGAVRYLLFDLQDGVVEADLTIED